MQTAAKGEASIFMTSMTPRHRLTDGESHDHQVKALFAVVLVFAVAAGTQEGVMFDPLHMAFVLPFWRSEDTDFAPAAMTCGESDARSPRPRAI